MPARIPEISRRGVLESWLAGDSRRTIAAKYGISEGAVSNIIDEWSRQRGPEQADLSRDLAVALSKTGISPLQCAQGYRVFTLLKRMGVDEESFESFINEMNKRYVAAGLDPGTLFEHISELHHFQENSNQFGVYLGRIKAIGAS
jgi:hypothetical protein